MNLVSVGFRGNQIVDSSCTDVICRDGPKFINVTGRHGSMGLNSGAPVSHLGEPE